MTKLKMMIVTSLVALVGFGGVAAAKHQGGQGRGRMMQKFDANGDGKLDAAEQTKAKEAFRAKRAQQQAQRIAQFDANKNGQLEPAEKQVMRDQRAQARFAKLDANKDGTVTLAEFKAAKAAKAANAAKGGKRGKAGMKP